MSLPKLVTKTLKPYVILLSIGMLFLAYDQLKASEQNAHLQSLDNLTTATNLVSYQVEAASSKLFLLNEAKTLNDFDIAAKRILKHSPIYADIISVNLETGQYRSALLHPTLPEKDPNIIWTPLVSISPKVAISSLYEKYPDYWVFAVKYTPNDKKQLWLEFDLMHATQSLRGLRTLDNGYVFVIDRHTGRLIFHPNPKRIGTASISYNSGISQLVESGNKFSEFEYYYRNKNKVAIFDADNSFDWVFIAGTDRSDILATSYQFGLTAIFIASLLYISLAISYLTRQLSVALANLSNQKDISNYKLQLRYTIDRFIPNRGIQFCLYDNQSGEFSTIDFHGNSRVVMNDKALAASFVPNKTLFSSKQNADRLAQKLQIRTNHHIMPLCNQGQLIGVVYIQTRLPMGGSIMRIIRDRGEIVLSNLLLHKSLLCKDVMTKLDNQHTMNASIDCHKNNENVYFAQLEVDFFDQILNHHGSQCADKITLAVAEMMQTCFPKPRAISLSRDGLGKFSLLFHAHDQSDALTRCEELRMMIEKNPVRVGEQNIPFTASIGGGVIVNNHQETICRVEKALHKAKGSGRNQVSFEVYAH
ncbi:sensor domain-containing diguanylate cyclase [Vibrio fluminensis]|uniref:sensor domain-containing diguanylate cyclase n=1 Tax=Vibrio fluminensis TaxID=2783614 RepID=UPI001E4CB858|nr:diguanylate cyclase [Vibrio fluminensis]